MPAELADSLTARGITEPFPIQAATLPDALAGRDVCGRAPTGSGKTLAFGLALVARKEVAEPRRPRGLVLVPTRELAAQVARRARACSLAPVRRHRRRHLRRRRLRAPAPGAAPRRRRRRRLPRPPRGPPRQRRPHPRRRRHRRARRGRPHGRHGVPARRAAHPRPDPRRPPDAAVLGHPRRRRRQGRPRYKHKPARHDVAGVDEPGDVEHLFWQVAERRPGCSVTASIVTAQGRTHRVLPHQARRRPHRPAARRSRHHRRRHPRRPLAGPARPGPRRLRTTAGPRPRRHRRRRPRHPRRRRRLRGALRPAGRPQGLRPPLRSHRPGRRHRLVVITLVTPEKRKDVVALRPGPQAAHRRRAAPTSLPSPSRGQAGRRSPPRRPQGPAPEARQAGP